ncbi:hypothetical protein Bbelb_367410 [Branchiostoma belcheri]|nr:hypothetical protein Bbelb_367410 [Branchiostoma belcheri]
MATEQATATSTTSVSPGSEGTGDWVRLNVGGTVFETTRTTLARLNSQFLDRLLAEDSGFLPPADGVYRIDRDPEVFRVLLNFARNGRLLLSPQVTSEMVLADADFYVLRQGALQALEGLDKEEAKSSSAPGQGKRNNVPATISVQCQGAGHHNGLSSVRLSGREKTMCVIDACKTKVSEDDIDRFRQTCISCRRTVTVKRTGRFGNDPGEIVAVEWCHRCLRCLDCQEIVCLP